MLFLRTMGKFTIRFAAVYGIATILGCSLTNDQIAGITAATQAGVAAVVQPIVSVAAPGIDVGAAAGIASAAGIGVAYLVKVLLNLMKKKQAEE